MDAKLAYSNSLLRSSTQEFHDHSSPRRCFGVPTARSFARLKRPACCRVIDFSDTMLTFRLRLQIL